MNGTNSSLAIHFGNRFAESSSSLPEARFLANDECKDSEKENFSPTFSYDESLLTLQELVIALQRTGDPGKLSALRNDLDLLSGLDPNPESTSSDWKLLNQALEASEHVVLGLLAFMSLHNRLVFCALSLFYNIFTVCGPWTNALTNDIETFGLAFNLFNSGRF